MVSCFIVVGPVGNFWFHLPVVHSVGRFRPFGFMFLVVHSVGRPLNRIPEDVLFTFESPATLSFIQDRVARLVGLVRLDLPRRCRSRFVSNRCMLVFLNGLSSVVLSFTEFQVIYCKQISN